MVALKTERRVFLWQLEPAAVPIFAKKPVTLKEVTDILIARWKAKEARVYLSESGRILEDNDAARDEKNQLYIADIKQDPNSETITFLINRGDPNLVSPAFINQETAKVRVVDPGPEESLGHSTHLVISTKVTRGKHRACFEKMPHLSSALVLHALDHIVSGVVEKDNRYTYTVEKKVKNKVVKETKRYRPMLQVKRVPSEKLAKDIAQGELSQVVLTKSVTSYNGVGVEKLVKRQQEKIVLHTRPAGASAVKGFIKGITEWGKEQEYEDITFHLDRLPGGQSNNPTLSLSELENQDALEQLYVRAQRLTDFPDLLEACYAKVCEPIATKMVAVVNGKHGW